ncbi:MAG: hypothetical protein IT383_25660 [Deltaproteobacteria bacterium]|nr:hypothetical protein [Deltaproteobacteria bacterium]
MSTDHLFEARHPQHVVAEIVLRRRGVVVTPPAGPAPSQAARAAVAARALAMELAALGLMPSQRLIARWSDAGPDALSLLRSWVLDAIVLARGGGVQHEPLFRRFPEDIPADTTALWWQRVLVHYLQTAGQPCIWCGSARKDSATHVLTPCGHVVCDACFDGSAVSACPICGGAVDRDSPFFQDPPRPLKATVPIAPTVFRVIDVCEDLDLEARLLVQSFCARPQALSPMDSDDLRRLVRAYGARVLPWLPESIVVRENVAWVFGTLMTELPPLDVVPSAAPFIKSATDVLRILAVLCGAAPALQGETLTRRVRVAAETHPLWRRTADALLAALGARGALPSEVWVASTVRRFKRTRIRRPLRRALLSLLEGLDGDALVEDMLRHRSWWVGVGELLHPHDYQARFPKVAYGFLVVRGRDPQGVAAPAPDTFSRRMERALAGGDMGAAAQALAARPGELGRRVDLLLRRAGDDARARGKVLDALAANADRMSVPLLLSLAALLPRRRAPLPVRVVFPKGDVSKVTSIPDRRAPLSAEAIAPALEIVEGALLARFARCGPVDVALVDEALADIIAPFNERTASRGAVSLPRGSRVEIPASLGLRLFLHWCQPPDGERTDVDLSVGFYDESWRHTGVCSYYQLSLAGLGGTPVAVSSGDLTSAPFPLGASEFVDVDLAGAVAAGHRFAVMVVNNYAGLPFSQLERGFAGVMLRDDALQPRAGATPFDPQTVALRFDLQGQNGAFLPAVVDLQRRELHWIDGYSTGQPQFNNVATSNRAIQRRVPDSIAYFTSGARATMRDLALLHAAARAAEVRLRRRSGDVVVLRRDPHETPLAFLRRLHRGDGVARAGALALSLQAVGTAFVALLRGDVEVPAGVAWPVYALFPGTLTSTVAAGDLLAVPA